MKYLPTLAWCVAIAFVFFCVGAGFNEVSQPNTESPFASERIVLVRAAAGRYEGAIHGQDVALLVWKGDDGDQRCYAYIHGKPDVADATLEKMVEHPFP